MIKSAKSQCIYHKLLQDFTCYSLTALLVVVLSDAAGATKNTELQIAQVEPISQETIGVAAKRAYADSFSENIVRESFTHVNTATLGLQIAQSPATKPTPSLIQPLIDKASQLFKEAIELSKQPSAASKRQAITKYEESLKIWRLPEVRAVIPQEARSYEALILCAIASTYGNLNENTKALGYLEQALAISREIKDRLLEARMLSTIGNIYGFNLTEYTKAVGYLEQALAILRESKEPKARSLQRVTLIVLGGFYKQLGEKQKAIDADKEAQSLSDADIPIHKANNGLQERADRLTQTALKYQNLGETEKALDSYRQALEIYRQTKDLLEQGLTLSSIGLVYSSRGDRASAEKYIQQALELQKTVQRQSEQDAKSQSDQIIILTQIAISYSALGDIQQQIVYLNQGRIIAHELGRSQDEAGLISDIGEAYYNLGETQKALDNFTQALKLQTEIKDVQEQAKTLVNIASIHRQSGEFQQALDILNQALEISKQKHNSLLKREIISQMSYVYGDLGAYELSIEKSKEVLAIYQQSNPRLVGSILFSIGAAYQGSCFYQEKPEDCRQALDYFNQGLTSARKQGSFSSQANFLGIIAKTYELLEDYPQAITNAKQALELSRKYSLKQGENSSLLYLSAAYERAGDYQNALNYSKQSLLLSQQLGDLTSQATVYKIQGKIYRSMNQPQLAIEVYNQELKLAQQIGDISQQTYPLYQIAVIERDRGNLNQARTQIETAIKIIENTRSNVNRDDLRTSYFATVQDYYKFYIDLLMQLHKKDPSKGYDALALHISERSRARSLIELLTEAHADIRKGVDPKLLVEEKRLRWKLDAQVKLLPELPGNKKVQAAALKKEIDNLLSQQKELQTKIRISSPKFAGLQYPDPERDILKLPQIQQQLDKDTLLLQYSLGEKHSYLWAVTPNSINSYELPGREAIETSAGKFKELLRKCQKPGIDCQKLPAEKKAKDFQETTQAATELSQLILAPVSGKLGKKRLVIVADGALQEIPFSALSEPNQISQLEKSPQVGKSNYQPLLVNHEIVNLPSVTAIATHRQDLNKRQAAPKTLAVLADPVFAADDKRVTGKDPSLGPELNLEQSSLQQSARNLNRAGWRRLLGTRTEAEQILKLVPPSESLQAFDFDANYNLATSPKLKQYRFILFATHGFADPIKPELSGIVLSQINKQGKPNIPSTLRLGDIFNLDLGADLVVLSACETGLGKDVQGEGLVGLTRGLMYAGAKRAVVSLWQVNDTATSKLMPQFYTAILQQKASPTTALREAQIKLWQQENWRNPYYWAAFTLQGEWR
ncbi:MAG: CHAT domain-containing protein [Komarekiella atlantica HA4396-MV6]|jgi:CHAT domain-containing protein/tetratricopeptide (TPR) repeat protein|nr:CHAT domain-containing protein [Komarekiella atlantica HA4396-MV6]